MFLNRDLSLYESKPLILIHDAGPVQRHSLQLGCLSIRRALPLYGRYQIIGYCLVTEAYACKRLIRGCHMITMV